MKNWTILCPGPSLKTADLMHLTLPPEVRDKVIAVNGALLKFFFVDWWTFLDPEVFTTVINKCPAKLRVMSPRPKIWCFWGLEEMGLSGDSGKWDKETHDIFKLFNAEVWHREENSPEIKAQYPESITPFHTYEYLPWNEFSMFAAISLAVKKGARTIKIYGADLKDKGYFHMGLWNQRTVHDEKRWTHEKILLDYITEACRLEGVEIIRK